MKSEIRDISVQKPQYEVLNVEGNLKNYYWKAL